MISREGHHPLHRSRTAYLFLVPWFAGLLGLTLFPILSSLYLSFTDYDLFTGARWIGVRNYNRMFSEDGNYFAALRVTFTYVFSSVPLQLVFALLLALLLNRSIKGLTIYRAIFYLPSFLGGSVAVAILWRRIFGINGVVNHLLSVVGVQGVSWIGHPRYALSTLMVLRAWQFGSSMIIFLAGLKQIPAEIYDSVSIDGARSRQRFFRITLPLLSPVVLFNGVMQTIAAFKAFTEAYIISADNAGGPANSLLFYTLYLYTKGWSHFEMGYASAMAWILLLITALFTALTFITSRRWVYYAG